MGKSVARLEELAKKVRSRGGRMTPQRMAILRALLTADHPTVEEVYEAVRRDFPMTSLATVYRTVSLLREVGEVMDLDGGDSAPHCDARPYPHAHLVCTECRRVADAPEMDARVLSDDIGRRTGGWALSPEIYFYGICPECRAQEAAGA